MKIPEFTFKKIERSCNLYKAYKCKGLFANLIKGGKEALLLKLAVFDIKCPKNAPNLSRLKLNSFFIFDLPIAPLIYYYIRN